MAVVIPARSVEDFAEMIDMDGVFEHGRFLSADGRVVVYDSHHEGQAGIAVGVPGDADAIDFMVGLEKHEGEAVAAFFRGESIVNVPLTFCVTGDDGHFMLDADGRTVKRKVYFIPERPIQRLCSRHHGSE